MNGALQPWLTMGEEWLRIAVHPATFVFLALLAVFYARQVALERRLFFVRLHSVWRETLQSALLGIGGGVAASALLVGLGVVVHPQTLVAVWVVAVVLAFLRFRYLCLAYAGGLVGFAAALAQLVPGVFAVSPLAPLGRFLLQVDVPSLAALVAILHLVESALVFLHGGQGGTPLFLRSRRGKLVGGYAVQRLWLLPLLVVVPAAGGSGVSGPAWWPAFGSGAAGWTVAGLPALIGYSDLALTRTAREKARHAAGWLLAYSLILLGLAGWARAWLPAALLASAFAAVGHEALIRFGRWQERGRLPLFQHDAQGLRVLAVLPGSPAEAMGIVPGDRLRRVNGMEVRSRLDLHAALSRNRAHCRLEIVDRNGEVRLAQRAVYATDHHQLGILLAPDEDAPYYVDVEDTGLLGLRGRAGMRAARRFPEEARAKAADGPRESSETASP
ncbi:MAG TPA: PDZ domain-containing protein [Calditerricola sp.]